MIFYALVLLMTPTVPAHAGCGAPRSASSDSTAQRIQRKFGLTVDYPSFCGEPAIEFGYRNADGAEKWLGVLQGTDEGQTAAALERIEALTLEQMDAVKASREAFAADADALESQGLYALGQNGRPVSERYTDGGELMLLAIAQHCLPDVAKSPDAIDVVRVPVSTLDGVALAGATPLYQEGDLVKTIRAQPGLAATIRRYAQDNLTPGDYRDRCEDEDALWNQLLRF